MRYFVIDMKTGDQDRELRRSVSISMLPSERDLLRIAAKKAGENSVSAFVKKVLMKAIEEAKESPLRLPKKGKIAGGR